MDNRETETEQRKVAPGEGERRAQRGLVPQYKVAAEKIYALLADGRLHSVGIADPEASTLDDIQLIRRHGGQLVLDAYQIKWSAPGETLAEGEFENLLTELVGARQVVVEAARRRAQNGEDTVGRVTAHLYTSRVASTAGLRTPRMRGTGRSLHAFIDSVWRPAQRELVRSLAEVDAVWQPYVEQLANACNLGPDELLGLARDLRIETGCEVEEELLEGREEWQSRQFRDDLIAIRAKLQDLVTARDAVYVWLSADELVAHLGPEWAARWRPRQEHVFPTRGLYEPLARTAERLQAAIDRYDHGYLALTGSPGSGKSTLLTRLLRTDDRVAARYYAYVPDNDSITRGEASAFLHDLYLAISGRRGRHAPAPRGTSLDVLREAFRDELARLGEKARRDGRTEIVLVDGLDHVERDPAPQHSLLKELPSAEEIPDGVVFVIGARGLRDLPAHVARVVPGDRHIETEPLERAGVLRLSQKAGMPELGERIFELSAGHPLLAQTYLSLAAGIDAGRRAEALAELPPSDGEVWSFYESVWETLSADPGVVALLAIVSRVRGTIRLSWLARTGPGRGEVERLAPLDYLFERSGSDRWTFFHSSFREFLRRRTAEVGGEANDALHRSHHEELADRCRRSAANDPERFERLFHLREAGLPEAVVVEATPARFREQLDALRPREAVRADIGLASGALAECHDPLGVVRLALAANELQVRSYQFPEDAAFARLLVAIGQPELAIAHVAEISTATAESDRESVAMKLVLALHDAGLGPEASRVFELYEPLEWFGARPADRRRPPRGPQVALTAWGRAAAVLRGAAYVVQASARLRSPQGLDDRDSYDEDALAHLRSHLLWEAAVELYRREHIDELEILHDALRELQAPGRDAAALLDLLFARLRDAESGAEREHLSAVDTEALPYWGKLELCERLLTLGDAAAARVVLDELPEPSLPERDFTRLSAEEPAWGSYYRYRLLGARLGRAADPVQGAPDSDKDYLEQVVLAARHVIAFAGIEGRQLAGETVSAAEVIGAIRRMHAFWATTAGRDDYRRPGAARALVSKRAIAVTERLGGAAVNDLFAYFRERWDDRRVNLVRDGTELLAEFAAAGIGDVSIRQALADLEAFHAEGESSAGDWVSLGHAWGRVGDLDAAARCCRRAVRSTLAFGSEKELQLGSWTRLLMPLMHGPQGERLAAEFGAALVALSREGSGGAPDHAARILLELTLPSQPLRAWELASDFLEGQVLGPDDVIEAFLAAAVARPGVHWWVTLAEVLVVIGADAPAKALRRAVEAEPMAARCWLAFLLERVAVEGRPSSRRNWRAAARDAAVAAGFGDELPLHELELEVNDDTPSSRSTDEREPPEPPHPVEELLHKLEERDPADYLSSEPGRGLIQRLDELDAAQLGRLECCLAGTEQEPELCAALALRAAATNDRDRAWEQGARAIELSRAGDWSRHWAGGPMLDLVPTLRSLDRRRTTATVFERFAELATTTDYFLSQVGAELADYVDVFEFPNEATAREVMDVAAALLRDFAPVPEPAPLTAGVAKAATDAEMGRAFERLTGWFLASPHIVAWQAAQRAVLKLLAEHAGVGVLEGALNGSEQEVLRACAVIETHVVEGNDLGALLPVLERLAVSQSLTERAAAISCLQSLGAPLPATATSSPRTALPPGLQLVLPPREHERSVATGIAEMATLWRREIGRLAAHAKIDEDALFEHVLARAGRLTTEKDAGDERMSREEGMLGWGFLRPSAAVMRRAVGEAAATLVDAGRVEPLRALRAARLLPVYDTELLRMRPARRPCTVATFVEHDRRQRLYEVSLEEIGADAESRLAREVEGWIVIGERTELALVDRAGHREQRWSGTVVDEAAEIVAAAQECDDAGALLHDLVGAPASYYRRRVFEKRRVAAPAIVGSGYIPPMESPSGWLGLHPRIARDLELDPDPGDPFAWLLDGEHAVRSLWWRSGYDRWPPWSDTDEVGEGWLVLASPPVVERWKTQRPLHQVWAAFTSRRGESVTNPAGELRAAGLWDL